MRNIEIISRAVIIEKGKILLCQEKGKQYFFLPGGHVEFGEFSEEALLRELEEEFFVDVKETELIGIAENRYFSREEEKQEVNFIYKVEYEGLNAESKESHIEFHFLTKEEFAKEDIRPADLKRMITKWQNDGKFFHIKMIDK